MKDDPNKVQQHAQLLNLDHHASGLGGEHGEESPEN